LLVARSPARRASLAALAAKGFKRGTVEVATRATLPARASSPDGVAAEVVAADGFVAGVVVADVVVSDIDGPASADALIRFLQERAPFVEEEGPPVVALIDDPDPRWVRAALRAGIHAIVSREPSAEELHLAISAADAGLVLLHPTSARGLLPAALAASESSDPGFEPEPEPLTARESEVLRLLGDGLGNKEIAARLSISEHTAKFHISSILGKLGASSRTEAVSQGIRRGLIPI
jgi:DNA-binding NarL/FixJ family response regulator